MSEPVIAYVRANDGNRDRLLSSVRKFAAVNNLAILDEYVEHGHTAEAWAAALRRLSRDEEPPCALLIPGLFALGESRREVRARLAGLRAAGIHVYDAEGGMFITWTVGQVAPPPAFQQLIIQSRND